MIRQFNRAVTTVIFSGKALLAFSLLLILLAASGCENKMHTQRGSVNGTVRDTLKNPVVGAVITSHRSLFKAETDKNGHFEFTSLDVGSHRLSVQRSGYYLASKTVEISYGQVLEGVSIVVEPIDNMITHVVAVRESNRAVIDVTCKEPMSILIGWREKTGARIQLPPTAALSSHQIVLPNLFAGSEYLYDLQGTTVDGRRYTAEPGSFKTVPFGDLQGAPAVIDYLKVAQGNNGPVLSWSYTGVDPASGFKLFRSENYGSLKLLKTESEIFAAQNSLVDETAIPGRIYQYGMQTVDLDGNASPMSPLVSIVAGGRITEDITWKKSWSPVSLNGDLIVPAGRTLTIEAGCVVRFAAEDNGRSGFRPNVCELIVEGTIVAAGSDEEPIRMISASGVPTRTDWDGIRLVAAVGQQGSVLKNIEISGAERAFTIYSSTVEIASVSVRFCQTGFSLQTASGTVVVGLNVEDCQTALTVENTFNCTVTDLKAVNVAAGAIIAGNSGLELSRFDMRKVRETGLRVVDRHPAKIRNGLIQSVQTGIVTGAAAADLQYLTVDAGNGMIVEGSDLPTIRNCIIVNRKNHNTGAGIEDKTGGAGRSYPYNNIYGYSQATVNCDQNGAAIINLDPLFVGGNEENFDYRLQAGSPVINASDRSGQLGAYGSDS